MRPLLASLVAAALLAGCHQGSGSTSVPTPTPGGPTPTPTAPTPTAPTSPTGAPASPATPPERGWADAIVRAGDGAYVVGGLPDGVGALWWIDDRARLSARAAPPGLPTRSGTAADDRVLELGFDGPGTGLALTGTGGDRRHGGDRRVYRTDDGARTWHPVHLPTREPPARVAVGGGATYVLTTACRDRSDCRHATLWSIDPADGASRTFDSLPPADGDPTGTALAAYGSTVWTQLGLGAGRGLAERSTDGGRTWRRYDAGGPCLSDQPVATSLRVLWSTCGTGMLEHFTRQAGSGPPVVVFPGEHSGTSGDALLPLTDTTAYAVVRDRHGLRLTVTRNGGRTTGSVARLPQQLVHRGLQVTFVSERIGYLLTGGRLRRTGDGGRHWREIGPPGS